MSKHTFKVSDVAHYSFNGDSYPCLVVATTPATVTVRKLRDEDVNSVHGERIVFRWRAKHYCKATRMNDAGEWVECDRSAMVMTGGTWALHRGYRREWNPHL